MKIAVCDDDEKELSNKKGKQITISILLRKGL